MKKTLVSMVVLLLGYTLPAQTLFTYGRHAVDKNEFLAAFNKNNPEDKSSRAKREYLEQFYIPFKLKVQAARDMHMDTLLFLQQELENYKRQITEDHLVADSAVQALCREAYIRSLKDIRLSHIFISFDEGFNGNPGYQATPEATDTTAAYQKIMTVYRALQGGADFSEQALLFSMDPSVKQNKGDIGFITVFSLPYNIESIAYDLQKGQFSEPHKSNGGYHIFLKTDERPAYGTMKGAQILLAFPPGITQGEKQVLHARADSLYRVLSAGADFDQLARRFSSDYNAATTGGVLTPDFKIGRYERNFENAVTALTRDGEFTKPFETGYGMHIVKRSSHIPVNTDSSQAITLFKPLVMADERIRISNDREARRILNVVGYKKLFEDEERLWQITEGLVKDESYKLPQGITEATPVFQIGEEHRTLQDWVDYIHTIKNNYRSGTAIPYATLMQHYATVTAKKYYRDHLERYNPAFKKQLQEFEDGNLFFEVMGRQVWNKGADNEEKLLKFYRQHQSLYTWGESINAILFTALDATATQDIRSNPQVYANDWKRFAKNPEGNIIADSSRFETAFLPGYKNEMPAGALSTLSDYSEDGPASLLYIISKQPGGSPKTFEEARGFVINDYQAGLDKKWQKSLRKKYRVKINETVFNTLE